MISAPGLGLGQLYVGNKKMGWTIMAVQLALLVLAGVVLPFSVTATRILFYIFLAILVYAAVDAYKTAKQINESL